MKNNPSALGMSINVLELAIKQAIANDETMDTLVDMWDSMMTANGHSDDDISKGYREVLNRIKNTKKSYNAEKTLEYHLREIEAFYLDHLD